MKATVRNQLVTVAVVLTLLAASLVLARRPYYNWDMFPYMALAMEGSVIPFEQTHREVYEAARAIMLPPDFEAITTRQPELMNDAIAFENVLPYYQIKPGYVLVVSALYNFGVHPLTATWVPSIASYLAVCMMCFFWTRRIGPPLVAALFTLVIAQWPVMRDLARYSSPDMLCTAFLVAGFLFLLESRVTAGLSILTAAVAIRPDAAILTFLIMVALVLRTTVSWTQALGFVGGQLLILYFQFSENDLLIQYSFLENGFAGRAALYAEAFPSLTRSFTLPFLVGILLLAYLERKDPLSLLSLMLWACLISILVRIAVHPYVEDRFNLPAYFGILLVGWRILSARFGAIERTVE